MLGVPYPLVLVHVQLIIASTPFQVPFTINTSSGRISLKNTLNYETSQHVYRLIITALDDSNAPPER